MCVRAICHTMGSMTCAKMHLNSSLRKIEIEKNFEIDSKVGSISNFLEKRTKF